MANVVVAMSGGVDSSVAAYLLKQQGHKVQALFMKNWEEDDDTEYCTTVADYTDCLQVCDRLQIKITSVNFAAEYWHNVFKDFIKDLKANITPNPDVLCNKEIKFSVLLKYAKHLGADYLATGHYASLDLTKDYALGKALDSNKDQSYFLHSVDPKVWSSILFPLANLTKTQVREIARQNNLITANKKDSTGICFIGERKFSEFIDKYIPQTKGNIVDIKGNVVGEHTGLFHYTIGQRKGIKIGGVKGYSESSWYVLDKNADKNELIVHQDQQLLYDNTFICRQLHWQGSKPKLPLKCRVKLRYRQREQGCVIGEYKKDEGYNIALDSKQRAITKGQYAVFYLENQCIGGGKISNVK